MYLSIYICMYVTMYVHIICLSIKYLFSYWFCFCGEPTLTQAPEQSGPVPLHSAWRSGD